MTLIFPMVNCHQNISVTLPLCATLQHQDVTHRRGSLQLLPSAELGGYWWREESQRLQLGAQPCSPSFSPHLSPAGSGPGVGISAAATSLRRCPSLPSLLGHLAHPSALACSTCWQLCSPPLACVGSTPGTSHAPGSSRIPRGWERGRQGPDASWCGSGARRSAEQVVSAAQTRTWLSP